jgi:hypothetical protein
MKSIYSDKPTKPIINITETQFMELCLDANVLIDFVQTKSAIIVGIKNQNKKRIDLISFQCSFILSFYAGLLNACR